LEKLKMKENNWLGICKTKAERFILNSEDLITPSVTCEPPQSSSCQLKASISFAEAFSSYFENIPRELVDDVLEELELCIMLLEAWPGEGQGDAGFELPRHRKFLIKSRKRCSLFSVLVKDFSMDASLQQHDNLNVALETWYSGDHTVIFPGEEAVNLSLLAKDIIIACDLSRVSLQDPSQQQLLTTYRKATPAERIVEFTASDDAGEDTHSKLIPDLSLEMNTDTLDGIKDSSVIHSWISKLHVAFGF
ncbi:LOW QUALITY PROTEIN: testicular spindle-associated protein SHCBP1L, partial [Phoenicopterus ruber ruber]